MTGCKKIHKSSTGVTGVMNYATNPDFMHYSFREIPEHYHRFVFFDSPQCGYYNDPCSMIFTIFSGFPTFLRDHSTKSPGSNSETQPKSMTIIFIIQRENK